MSADPREDAAELPALLARVQALAAFRLAELPALPAARPPVALPPAELPRKGAGTAAVLERFASTVAPHLSASTGPRYLGFVTGGVTPAALVGDWLVSLYDQNAVSELDSAVALQVERDTVAMLRDLFCLPDEFEGSFVTGATLSNFVGLAVAREWAGRQRGSRVSAEGLWQQAPVPVLAAAPHASVGKALSMLGMGRSAWQPVACLPDREAMDVTALASTLDALDGPAIVVASAGTVQLHRHGRPYGPQLPGDRDRGQPDQANALRRIYALSLPAAEVRFGYRAALRDHPGA